MEIDVHSEPALLERARKFDHQALAEIYDLYSPGIYRYAMRLLGNPNLAEDCVSETFSRFLHAVKRHKGPRDHLQAYLYRTAHNWVVDLFRREPVMEELADEQSDPGLDPESTAEQNIHSDQIRAALRRLTPDQQQVILLKYMEDLDNETVAQMLHKPVGAVKSLQHRALTSLQRIMKDGI